MNNITKDSIDSKKQIFAFNYKKAIETILYIAENAPVHDVYRTLKIILFANKNHLQQYGCPIYHDNYVALRHGTVPIHTYYIITSVNFKRYTKFTEEAAEYFRVTPKPIHTIIPLKKAEIKLLTKSEKECLNIAIDNYDKLSMTKLKELSYVEGVGNNDWI